MPTDTWTIEDDRLAAVIERGQERLELCLSDRESGRRWGPARLVDLEVYCKDEFRAVVAKSYRIDAVEASGDRLHVVIGHAQLGVRLGLWLAVEGGELVVRMPIPEVYEDRASRRLFSVIVLPELMSVGADGRMLLPLNTGCLTRPADKPALADRFMIYGEQSRWELVPMLPACGVGGGEGGLMAIATGAAAETECHVRTDGNGGGTLAFGMSLRQFWPDPVEWRTREIRYRPVPAEGDLLHEVAARLRRHLIEDRGKPTLKQRIAESPELAYLMDGYTMKLFFAVENRGLMMEGAEKGEPITYQRVMTCAEAEANLKRLHDAGIDKVYTQMTGWNPNGHDGLYPTRFPVDERIGGEAGFRRLIDAGHALGYQMNVHDNAIEGVERSPDFDFERVIHDQWGGPMRLGEWGGGPTLKINNTVIDDAELEAFFRQAKDRGLTGMGYLDGMGNPLYRDYHPRHRLTRSGYAAMTNRLIEMSRKVHGAAGTECGFMYCAAAADSVVTGGSQGHWNQCSEAWPITRLMDRRVPLYRLVFSGLVFQECQQPRWRRVMESVSMGLHPRDEWAAHPGPMPVFNDDRIAKLKAVYDIACRRFGHLKAEQLVSWAEEDGVETTKFDDGTEVIADYRREKLIVNGEAVERPEALK